MTISPLNVLRSQAGYYIGSTYFDQEIRSWLPYSRVSAYYRRYEEALNELYRNQKQYEQKQREIMLLAQ